MAEPSGRTSHRSSKPPDHPGPCASIRPALVQSSSRTALLRSFGRCRGKGGHRPGPRNKAHCYNHLGPLRQDLYLHTIRYLDHKLWHHLTKWQAPTFGLEAPRKSQVPGKSCRCRSPLQAREHHGSLHGCSPLKS